MEATVSNRLKQYSILEGMANKVVRYLFLSQLNLLIFLGICTVIMPGYLFERNEGGVSNYGVHNATVVPFTLAFLLSGVFVLLAAYAMPRSAKQLNRLRYALYGLSGLLALNLATTYGYKTSAALNNLHITSVIIIFWFEMAMAAWMVLALLKDRTSAVVLAIQFIGFLMGGLTLIGTLHLLFVTQVITGLAFGILLVRSGQRLAKQP